MVPIPSDAIPLVVRFTPPSVSLQFLDDLRSLVVDNFTLTRAQGGKSDFGVKRP